MNAKDQQQSLFDRLGGKAAVDAAVDIFYGKILNDPSLAGFFTGIDMNRQRSKQKIFMTYAFGGLPSYSGQSLRGAHQRLVQERGLNDLHFNAVAEHLVATLQELKVAEPLIAEVVAIVSATRKDVLNR